MAITFYNVIQGHDQYSSEELQPINKKEKKKYVSVKC